METVRKNLHKFKHSKRNFLGFLEFCDLNENDKSVDLLKRMISDGYDVNSLDSNGNTALHLLLSHYLIKSQLHGDDHHWGIVLKTAEILLKYMENIDMQNNQSEACLLLAAKCFVSNSDFSKQTFLVKLFRCLLDKGASVNLRDGSENTVLHLAAGDPFEPSVISLVRDCIRKGIDVNATDKQGQTALMITLKKMSSSMALVYGCSPDLCRLLLWEGGSTNVMDTLGYTPLQLLVSTRFISKGKERYVFIEKLLDNSGENCLLLTVNAQIPVSQNSEQNSNPLAQNIESNTGFLRHIMQFERFSCLQIAVMKGYLQIQFRLLQAGANVHVTYEECQDHITLFQQSLAVMLFSDVKLVHRQAPINETMSYFRGLLHLLSAGASYHLCSVSGSPSRDNHKQDCVSYLFQNKYHTILEGKLLNGPYSNKMCHRVGERLSLLGYQFKFQSLQILNSRRNNVGSDSDAIKLLWSLEILAARAVRQNMYPNAWVASKTLPLPARLKSKHFKVPRHFGDVD